MSDRATSIYVIQEEGDEALKIGIAHEPQRRLGAVQTGNARQLYLMFDREFHTKDYARKVEYMAHTLLKGCRREGEWFSTTLELATKTVEDAIFYTDKFLSRLSEIQVAEMSGKCASVANDA